MSYAQYLFNVDASSGDLQRNAELENGGIPFGQGLSNWFSLSPGFHLDKVKAPLLISALAKDSLIFEWGTYAGLRTLNKPVDMFWLKDAPHILVNPAERYISQQSAVDWFDFWLNGHEDTDPAKAEQYARWRELRKLQADQQSRQPATPQKQ